MSLLQHLARACGFLVIRRRHAGAGYIEHPPRTAFDHTLLRCFPSPRALRFIQIGANDGQRADPLLRYIDGCAWSGLMFEPRAINFAALSKRHGNNPRLRLRPCAVDSHAGRRMLYDLDCLAHPSLPDWAHGLGSFNRERILLAAHELGLDEKAIITEEITTMSWTEVWQDFGPHRCDLLVLDTEGHDLPLLHTADLGRHRPRIIHFEHACATPAERLEFCGKLLALGYELSTEGPDTTAWLPA